MKANLNAASPTRAVLAAVAVGIATTLLLAFGFGAVVELPVRDVALRALPSRPAANTIIVAIDELSLRGYGRWPWPRAVLAEIIDRIADGGARALVVDTLLAEPSAGDDALATAMRRVPTIAVAAIADRGEWILPTAMIRDASTVAHGNFERDRDGILRRFASTKQRGDRSMTALSIEAASMVTSSPVPVGRSVTPAFRTHPRMIPVISAADLLRGRSNDSALRGKVVFFGPVAVALGDRVLTPVSIDPDPGVTVHAAAAESLIRGELITATSPLIGGLLCAIAVGSVVASRQRLVTAATLVVAIVAGGMALLSISGVALPFATLLSSVLIATGSIQATVMARSLRESEQSLEALATRLAERRAEELESKRVLAHELKTPLASMRGLTQLLTGYELTDPERRRISSLLETEAGKLQSMVTALLDLERLPLRDFMSGTDVLDLGDLVSMRVQFLQASTDRPLDMSIARGLFVRADASLIDRVVDNLVGNALKYAPGKSPLTIIVERRGADVTLEVEDRGPGVSAADRHRIFKRFARGSTAAGTEGLGLGLSLVAEVAQWHGGGVTMENVNGGGARFRVTLPAVSSEVARVGVM